MAELLERLEVDELGAGEVVAGLVAKRVELLEHLAGLVDVDQLETARFLRVSRAPRG